MKTDSNAASATKALKGILALAGLLLATVLVLAPFVGFVGSLSWFLVRFGWELGGGS